MSQHDYSIANQGFPATRADLNNALSAIATNNSGTSAPSTQYAGQFWIDTTSSTWTLYIHDGTDDIQFATIDTSANTVNFIDSELGDNSVTTAKIADGNVTSAKLSYPLTTFSSTGIDDNATSTAITIDSNENVGIGTASPNNYTNYKSLTINGTTGGLIDFESNGTLMGEIYCDTTKFLIDSEGAVPLVFRTNSASERMRIDSSGNVGIGTSTPTTIASDTTIGSGDIILNVKSSGDARIVAEGTGGGSLVLVDSNATTNQKVVRLESTGGKLSIQGDSDTEIGSGGGAGNIITADLSNGNVGIGTSSPSRNLHIHASQPYLQLTSSATGTTSLDGFQLICSQTDGEAIIMQRENANMSFYTSGTERMRILSTGEVLIAGTSIYSGANPELHIEGDIDLGNGGTATERELTFSRSASTGVIGRINSRIAGFSTMPMIEFGCTSTGGGTQAGDLKFYTTSSATRALRMTIADSGAVSIVGSLSKGSGSFKIDHPLPEKKDTHYLVHSFTESPQADLIYRGKVDLVNGTATVNIDTVAGMTEGTFVLLNREIQCFTSNETGWTAVKGSVSGNILTITAQDNTCTDTISWLVIGERQDQHMIDTEWTDENGKVIVEPLKETE